MKNKIKYYDIRDDLKKFPDAWAYLVYSKRGPGKTYSTLRMMVEDKAHFVFSRRTNKEVDIICTGAKSIGQNFDSDKETPRVDLSPYKPLNRDFGWNIQPVKLAEGIAAFYDFGEDNHPCGLPIGYIISLHAIKDAKGFDMSECEFLVVDEFIPKPWERVERTEGDSVLDLYMTILRDRIERGLPPVKLICLANATSISNPIFNTLDVIDAAAELNISGEEFFYDEYRGILLHQIPADSTGAEEREKIGIEKAMENTPWGSMAFGGKFGYNDFTNIKHERMKNYIPVVGYIYKHKTTYIYMKEGKYYATRAKNDHCKIYDLTRETEQKLFYQEFGIDLRLACIEGKFSFESYSAYDLIMNFKKIFRI